VLLYVVFRLWIRRCRCYHLSTASCEHPVKNKTLLYLPSHDYLDPSHTRTRRANINAHCIQSHYQMLPNAPTQPPSLREALLGRLLSPAIAARCAGRNSRYQPLHPSRPAKTSGQYCTPSANFSPNSFALSSLPSSDLGISWSRTFLFWSCGRCSSICTYRVCCGEACINPSSCR
jgi:hypothetical protein